MRFEPAFLDEIRNRLLCSDVCGRRVLLKKAGKEWRGLSPFNNERSPSFFVNDAKRAWFDFSSGRNGNVFDFVMAIDGLSFPQAVAQCARDAGLNMPADFRSAAPLTQEQQEQRRAVEIDFQRRQALEQRREEESEEALRSVARRIWTQGKAIAGTDADEYMKARGIDFAYRFPSLRFHPRLEHRNLADGAKTHWPALIAAVQHPATHRFLGVWRIWLDGKGDKAPIDPPKMGLGSYAPYGGCVRLGEPTAVANVCEGIETGCGIVGLLSHTQGVQAALSTSGMVNFVPPSKCKSTLIWPDGDTDRIKVDKLTGEERHAQSPGHRAAETLQGINQERGHPSSIQPIPKRAIDWLDVWNKAKDKYSQ